MRWHTVSAGVIVALVAITLSFFVSCSIVDRTSYEDHEGRIPESFFSKIRRGKTSQDWIVGNLGEPERLQKGPGSQEIYTYRLMRAQEKHAGLLIVLRYDGVYRDVEYFHVFFEDGLVRRHWRDEFVEVQTHRYFDQAAEDTMDAPDTETEEPLGQAAESASAESLSAPRPEESDAFELRL